LEDRLAPAVFTVTNLGDNGGVNPTVGAGTGTLRQAIVDADAAQSASGDQIVFSGAAASGLLTLQAELPAIYDANLQIMGPGSGSLAISGANFYRVFFVVQGNVSISGLTVEDGLAQGGHGGPGNAAGGGGAGLGGGLLINAGSVALTDVVFTADQAVGGNAGTGGGGGGGGGGGAGGHGGGVDGGGGGFLGDGGTGSAVGGGGGGGGFTGAGGAAGTETSPGVPGQNVGGGGGGGEPFGSFDSGGAGAPGGGSGAAATDNNGGGGGGGGSIGFPGSSAGADGTTPSGGNGGFGGGGGGGPGPFTTSGNGGDYGGGGGNTGSPGAGGFGGGGGGAYGGLGGVGGFGGGGGGGYAQPNGTVLGGMFGGNGVDTPGTSDAGGGGGAGLGGAIFLRAGSLLLTNVTFMKNAATGGNPTPGGDPTIDGTPGQGKGGALFIYTGASAQGENVTFSGDSAQNAGSSTTDNADIYGSLTEFPLPTLSVSLTNAGGSSFTVGQSVSYSVAVTNGMTGGPVLAGNPIQVTMALPAGLANVTPSGTGWSFMLSTGATGPTTLTATYTGAFPVAVGAALPTFTLTATLTADAVPSLTATATVSATGDSGQTGETSSDNVNAAFPPPTLTVSLSNTGGSSFTVGQSVTYSVALTNGTTGGPVLPGNPIQVTVAMPAGLDLLMPSGSNPDWSFQVTNGVTGPATLIATYVGPFPVAVGASLPTFTFTATLSAAALPSVTETASVTTTGDIGEPGETAADTVNVTIPVLPPPPILPPPHLRSTAGEFDPTTVTWYLRNEDSAGPPETTPFSYGFSTWTPVVGDWDGNGTMTIGVVDTSTATWYLRNENNPGVPDAGQFQFGAAGWIPVVGDWNNSGHTRIGMYDPTTQTWYLRNEASAGAPDAGVFQYGAAGWIPVTGDWDGNGTTTIGVWNPVTATWYLRNSNSAGAPDITPFSYGFVTYKPITGDWSGNGVTSVGVIDPNSNWYLRDENTAGVPDGGNFNFGLGSWSPVPGSFGTPTPTSASVGNNLTQSSLDATVGQALHQLAVVGVGTDTLDLLAKAHFVVGSLPPGEVASTEVASDQVTFSPDAAGLGWSGSADLLTALAVEMGSLSRCTNSTLPPGTLTSAQHEGFLDAFFSTRS
jgi:hypothetical protein